MALDDSQIFSSMTSHTKHAKNMQKHAKTCAVFS